MSFQVLCLRASKHFSVSQCPPSPWSPSRGNEADPFKAQCHHSPRPPSEPRSPEEEERGQERPGYCAGWEVQATEAGAEAGPWLGVPGSV